MKRKLKARKEHKCDVCEDVIKPAEYYISEEGRHNVYSKESHYEEQIGIEYYRHRTCLRCYEEEGGADEAF